MAGEEEDTYRKRGTNEAGGREGGKKVERRLKLPYGQLGIYSWSRDEIERERERREP